MLLFMIRIGVVRYNSTLKVLYTFVFIVGIILFKTTTIALIGGIGLGFIAGLLVIIGLPYFYDDPISEVTITSAIPYMLYWLCK